MFRIEPREWANLKSRFVTSRWGAGTFVRLRRMVIEHAELAARRDRLERDYDAKLKVIFDAIRQLMLPRAPPAKRIGFQPSI